ncbi:hypothetical protein ACFWIA_13475 [Streptomyces sp. NPDC127068]|uniref:hypothetical protein n=1 Tax=Streptomyces sp. NPDC127068 TaxID=3347127 RepID=UPI003647C9B7
MADAQGGWKRQGFIPVSRRAPDRAPDRTARGDVPPGRPPAGRAAGRAAPGPAGPTPRYAGAPEPEYRRLAETWRREGRSVPGRPDPEWESLVRREIWPR